MSERKRVRDQQRHRDTGWPVPQRREHQAEPVAPLPSDVRTPAGILALQRLAGNRAATAFVQGQPADPDPAQALTAAVPKAAPNVQRGVWSFIGGVVKGAASYVGDVGRGFKRSAKGLRVWNPDALIKMHEENASAARLFGRLVSDPKGTVTAALTGIAGGLTTFAALPGPLKNKATDKFKDAAPGIIEGIVAKSVGKALAQKAFVVIANRILLSGVFKQLAKKLGVSAAASKTGVGIPLAVFSSLGLIEKASAAADRLQSRFPHVYRRLAADDLHLLWFVIEPHVPAIMSEVYATVDDYIDRTRPDGRVLVDAGGGNDRTPIGAGPDRQPVRSGGGAPRRIPIRSGGG
ncbi:MAG: hypothetical protein GEU74_08165 [Nitriliruptorales bacterium]|nr:hypothetical protein [Nitriliruptorales bacterium]